MMKLNNAKCEVTIAKTNLQYLQDEGNSSVDPLDLTNSIQWTSLNTATSCQYSVHNKSTFTQVTVLKYVHTPLINVSVRPRLIRYNCVTDGCFISSYVSVAATSQASGEYLSSFPSHSFFLDILYFNCINYYSFICVKETKKHIILMFLCLIISIFSDCSYAYIVLFTPLHSCGSFGYWLCFQVYDTINNNTKYETNK